MNYDALVYEIIESLKEEKSIPAEYRNAVVSSARRLQMEIRGAKTMTVLKAPEGIQGNKVRMYSDGDPEQPYSGAVKPTSNVCTCPDGARRTNCPVHGNAA